MAEEIVAEVQEAPANGSPVGLFNESLIRSNKKIKADRAASIVEDAQLAYKRKVEDLAVTLKRLYRQRDNMLDLSPENTMSLMLADNFDSNEYANREFKIAEQIRNTEVLLGIVSPRYTALFGDTLNL